MFIDRTVSYDRTSFKQTKHSEYLSYTKQFSHEFSWCISNRKTSLYVHSKPDLL